VCPRLGPAKTRPGGAERDRDEVVLCVSRGAVVQRCFDISGEAATGSRGEALGCGAGAAGDWAVDGGGDLTGPAQSISPD